MSEEAATNTPLPEVEAGATPPPAEPTAKPDDAATKPNEPATPAKKPVGNPSELDLVFVMDCTGSMGSYIASACSNIQRISEELVAKEKADVRLALVKYRDHPPQDDTFVTDVHDFTSSVRQMKSWLDGCSAAGGGDGPEAVADGLHAVLKLSWRESAVKFCILIADAPPHGLNKSGDGFPDGCPLGLDPVQIVNTMAEKSIILYVAGCEPSLRPYRDFFSGLAHVTGGQYVPLTHAAVLAKVIIGGAQEELSLRELVQQLDQEMAAEVHQAETTGTALDREEMMARYKAKASSYGSKVKQLNSVAHAAPVHTKRAENIAVTKNMKEASELYNTTMAEDTVEDVTPALSRRSRALEPFGDGVPSASFSMSAVSMPSASYSDEACYSVAEETEVSAAQVDRLVTRGLNKIQTAFKK